jgi:hypothetical protein
MGVFVWHSTEKTKTSKKNGSLFSLDAGTDCPRMVELVQKEQEDLIYPRGPRPLVTCQARLRCRLISRRRGEGVGVVRA